MNILRFVAPSEADTRQLEKTRANDFIVSEPALAALAFFGFGGMEWWDGPWMGRAGRSHRCVTEDF